MLFNSIHFAIFLPIVFILYWFVFSRRISYQNSLLLVSSYFFYACWDWRFLFLLMFSTFLDYYTGIKMFNSKSPNQRKVWFWISITANVGFLCFFKYFDFFSISFSEFISNFGFKSSPYLLNIILPVGISFYTFHGLSYVIDIYKNKITPEKNVVTYALFVSYFPLLVAGPIERATHLLPQIKKKRYFNYSMAVDGLRQIVWGLFKKIVIADQCAIFVDYAFSDFHIYNGSTLYIGMILFLIQLYCDFSGYSDIAMGVSKLFGIDLLRNFAFPFFSRNCSEFWRRWHISLNTWFIDYVFIPLGGSKKGSFKKYRNIVLVFLISGLWHGANWTFIVWGLLNGLIVILSYFFKQIDEKEIVAHKKTFPSLHEFLSILITFNIISFTFLIFRSKTLSDAFEYIKILFSESLFSFPAFFPKKLLIIIFCFIIIEWIGRESKFAIEKTGLNWKKPLRYSFYYVLVLLILFFAGNEQQYIYFQF